MISPVSQGITKPGGLRRDRETRSRRRVTTGRAAGTPAAGRTCRAARAPARCVAIWLPSVDTTGSTPALQRGFQTGARDRSRGGALEIVGDVGDRVEQGGDDAGRPPRVAAADGDDLAAHRIGVDDLSRAERARPSSSATAVYGRSATPRPWRTIFFAASMLSSSMTPRGITPFSRRYEAVTSW